jgi:hypothetical protein
MAIITSAKRNQAIGLLAIGATMFLGSHLAENQIPAGLGLEFVQFLVILSGMVATAMIFRRGRDSEKSK